MLPPLDDGALPDGIHDATADEVVAAFGRFQGTDRRPRLTDQLVAYLDEARRAGIITSVVIDGSYVTAKADPEDIAVVVVYRADVDTTRLRPFEYNAISKRVIRSTYRFDAITLSEADPELTTWLNFFRQVNPLKPHPFTARATNGLVRVVFPTPVP
jgi:hypothetical protein